MRLSLLVRVFSVMACDISSYHVIYIPVMACPDMKFTHMAYDICVMAIFLQKRTNMIQICPTSSNLYHYSQLLDLLLFLDPGVDILNNQFTLLM